MKKEQLILKAFVEQIATPLQARYARLYKGNGEEFDKIFTYFHQELDGYFDFLNQKNNINKHYNAYESRMLMKLMDEFEELQYSLNEVGTSIVLDDSYEKAIEICRNFLTESGGSTIPDDFMAIRLKKFEPIFTLPAKMIVVPETQHKYQLSLVGQGAFATVQQYRDSHYDCIFALKQAKKNLEPRELERFKHEFEILKKLSFPYILEVYSYDTTYDRYTMEFCDFTLDDYLRTNGQKLSFSARKKLALQFLYGINYLHHKQILHRDISYRNILLKKYDFNATIVKLSDFGLAKELKSDFTKSDSEIKGTIVDPSIEKFKDYNLANEIYSIGFILLFIFTSKKNLPATSGGIFDIVNQCTHREIPLRYKDVTTIIDAIDGLRENTKD